LYSNLKFLLRLLGDFIPQTPYRNFALDPTGKLPSTEPFIWPIGFKCLRWRHSHGPSRGPCPARFFGD